MKHKQLKRAENDEISKQHKCSTHYKSQYRHRIGVTYGPVPHIYFGVPTTFLNCPSNLE